ncbi:MAG: hypothetical protein HC933_10580 [Pleurocapsa sp. SU_196_0]|nr:hypothetical protein [Pleurocapsa sp. SU_196_0]
MKTVRVTSSIPRDFENEAEKTDDARSASEHAMSGEPAPRPSSSGKATATSPDAVK